MTKNLFIRIIWLPGWLLCAGIVSASGQNLAVTYLETGTPTPINEYRLGMAGQVSMRVSPRVSAWAGIRLSNQYPSGLGDLKVGASVFLKKDSERWSCENEIVFSNYAPYPMNQLYYRLTFAWDSPHFRIDFGNAFAFFLGSGVAKYHLLRPSFSLKGRIRDEDSSWNIAPFIRNFNRFEAHGSRCMEWGAELTAKIADRWTLFLEPYIVTAGNFNGTATFYNFNCLIGGAFVW